MWSAWEEREVLHHAASQAVAVEVQASGRALRQNRTEVVARSARHWMEAKSMMRHAAAEVERVLMEVAVVEGVRNR